MKSEKQLFDFKNPDYSSVFNQRSQRLLKIRQDDELKKHLCVYYRNNIVQFIDDWGVTYDPRNIERNLPAIIPFVLFDRQKEWIDELMWCWQNQKPLASVKSRDMGLSWLSVAAACSICLFYKGVSIGFGSRKEEYVDKIGQPKSIFFKLRMFMVNLPPEFRGGFDIKKHSPFMRLEVPASSSIITGECGDGIGRGDRQSIYIVDEAAFLPRPQLTESSLSATTNCRIDISTPNGSDNPFADKVRNPKYKTFIFHWRDDPRKDIDWYNKQIEELDPVTVAQEIDIDFNASKEGIVIPSAWVQSAIDAHEKLGIEITGERCGAYDVADRGIDLNAFCGGQGILIDHLELWSGKEATDDIFESVERCFMTCDMNGYESFRYDGDGLGAACKGDARVINERRKNDGQKEINVNIFCGSHAVVDPKFEMVKGRKNVDMFANHKAQSWWHLRLLFRNVHRAVNGKSYDPDEIISLSSKIKGLEKLTTELSQPTYSLKNGKILVDKQPDGSKSPNAADSVMIYFSPSDLNTFSDLLKLSMG